MADTDAQPAAANETSNEDLIAQKILKRAEIAKMTRQLKTKLFKAGMKVRDQNNNNNNSNGNGNGNGNGGATTGPNALAEGITTLQAYNSFQQSSSAMSSPMSSPSKSLSEDVTNNITATAISNIQNSKMITPTRTSFGMAMTQVTPNTGSPLKRKNSSIYRSTVSTRSRTLYDEDEDEEEENDSLISPLKRHHSGLSYASSPYNNASTSPFQLKQSIIPTPTSAASTTTMQPPKTPPQKQGELFQPLTLSASSSASSSQRRTKHRDSFTKQQKENLVPWNEPQNVPSTPNGNKHHQHHQHHQQEELGADLLMFLSNSPARTFSAKEQKDYSRVLLSMPTMPTTPQSASHLHAGSQLESTPLRSTPGGASSFLPQHQQPLLGTPIGLSMTGHMLASQLQTPNNRSAARAAGLNRTPFSLSDYINLTPSPRLLRTPNAAAAAAAAAESSLHQALFKH